MILEVNSLLGAQEKKCVSEKKEKLRKDTIHGERNILNYDNIIQ